ncbi:MAG TPA: hypothetical protein VNA88_17615, partial [Candidatus Kapabacteria bacterium]|nr:hypothetical protein [Candidatus Kapabacteria bacterium]
MRGVVEPHRRERTALDVELTTIATVARYRAGVVDGRVDVQRERVAQHRRMPRVAEIADGVWKGNDER